MSTLTELDKQIIALIEENGRRSNRDIGKLLGVSARQAGARLDRMIAEDVIRVITVVDAYAAGFEIFLAIGVRVANPPAAVVAEQLARLPNVIAAALMAGAYDIEIMIAVENQAALATLIKRDLGQIPGIGSLHPSLFLDVVKYETGSGPVSACPVTLEIPAGSKIDEVDRAVIARLWQNPWDTNENIAAALGLSESTVRLRLGQLRSRDLIHITAIRNVAFGEDAVFAIVGIELATGARQDVLDALTRMRQVHLVANVMGRYDIMAQVLVANAGELSELLYATLARLPGVRNIHCAQALKVLKYDPRWRIVGPQAST